MADTPTCTCTACRYMNRLAERLRTARHVRRAVLLALDRAHDAHGNPTDHMQGYMVPDADVRAWCQEAPELFLYGASIHPHRPEALLAASGRLKEDRA